MTPVVYTLPPLLDSFSQNQPQIRKTNVKVQDKQVWNLHSFDPNYTKAIEFKKMGFSVNFISNWFGQKAKVGFVKSFEDFNSIALLTDEEKQKVKPYLDFSRYAKQEVPLQNKSVTKLVIDINLADSLALQRLPGIGKVLSSRIVKYRNRLGGFVSKSQLKEVYGLSEDALNLIDSMLICSGKITPIPINQVDSKTLAKHPYITYQVANKIIRYRTQHGKFQEAKDLEAVYGLDSVWIQQILPYLTFN